MEEQLQGQIEQMGVELMVSQDTINELQSLLTQSLQERARYKIAQQRALEEIARLEKLVEEKESIIVELSDNLDNLSDLYDVDLDELE
ncbi:MAG: hypothetical protein ABS916_09195 [Carnobacterium sp.]|uniref:hypothetical protein n=1 Tax=Carnobacterium sp. TaxID=48221 RepID=UPI0033149BE4